MPGYTAWLGLSPTARGALLAAKEHSKIIIVEEGAVGGFGSHVLQFMALDGLLDGKLMVRPMCLPDRWIDHGTQSDQLHWAGLDAQHIAATALNMVGKPSSAQILV